MMTIEKLLRGAGEASDPYQSIPVPLGARHGFGGPALLWSGFGAAFICAVIGAEIQRGLGTIEAIIAILIGNWILFVYSAAIGFASGKWGMNSALTLKAVFGGRGALVPILMLALLVIGWFAFQAVLTAEILGIGLGITDPATITLMAIGAGIFFALPVILDTRYVMTVMRVALPAMVLFAGYYLALEVAPFGAAVLEGGSSRAMTFSTGVAMAWGTFVVSGTMTGDIVRFTRTGNQAVTVTAVAFLLSNAPFMLLGTLIAAVQPGDGLSLFFGQSGWLMVAIMTMAVIGNWASCEACLTNAALGIMNAFPRLPWRVAAVSGTLIALLAIATGSVGDLQKWLTLLAVVVPPIGGLIISDYYVVRRMNGFGVSRSAACNWAAVIALAIGILTAEGVRRGWPEFLFSAAGVFASVAAYLTLARWIARPLGARLTSLESGAEATD